MEKEETLAERLGKVPLEKDEAFLKAIKAELVNLMYRVRSEAKQKLDLLQQLRVYREKEGHNQTKINSSVQCDISPKH